jgi:hypothetical protein
MVDLEIERKAGIKRVEKFGRRIEHFIKLCPSSDEPMIRLVISLKSIHDDDHCCELIDNEVEDMLQDLFEMKNIEVPPYEEEEETKDE